MNRDFFFQNYISIGKITKPHGVKGFLKFLIYNEDSNILLDRKKLVIKKDSRSIELNIEKLNLTSNFLLIKFFDINDRDSAENYRNYEIYIPRSELAENDDLFLNDFIECDLYFDENKIGSVIDVVSYSTNNLLKVIDLNNKEHLIPIKKELIKFFDIKDRKLVIKTIEGILDIC